MRGAATATGVVVLRPAVALSGEEDILRPLPRPVAAAVPVRGGIGTMRIAPDGVDAEQIMAPDKDGNTAFVIG
jgi:hypothetical protein